jgi:alkylation response protein AidB-like acyl-CoA dehydrogenase
MDFGLTDEQEQLAQAERSWLERHNPIERLRQSFDHTAATIDPAACRHAAESGLLSLLTPDMGGTHMDLAVLSEAHGYAASSLPIADLAIAIWLLHGADAPQAVPAGEGELLLGVALGPEAAESSSGGLRLAGRTQPVPMAAETAGIVVVGQFQNGCGLGEAEYLAIVEGPELSEMTTLDLTRSWARVDLDVTIDADNWFALPSGTVSRVRDARAVHRALDALGAAARLLDMSVTYAGQRQQFGVPIGSFQAVKHHCSNMAIGVEAGRSALWAAALALDTAVSSSARSRTASSGVAYAKAAASEVAGTALQVHGGIGFTWEHDLHLLMRRIKVDEAMDGTVAEHRAALVTV